MNDVKQFFNDLYRDLSDRHLLLPAIVLLVAIVAVPMLLKSSPAATAPAPVAAPVTDEATEVESAVLAADPGIRDYSQRLEALKKKNPFVQQFADDEGSSGAAPTEVAGDLSSGSTVAPDTGGSTVTPETSGGATPVPGDDTTGAPTDPTTPTDTTAPQEPAPEVRFFAPRVDVSFGELGDAKEINNVRHFDFLPNQKTPVVAFLGLGESADKAVFAVSNEVAETSGEGSCSPHESEGCDLLILRVGQQRNLKLVDGTTFKLKLLDTHFTRIPDPRNEGQSDESGG